MVPEQPQTLSTLGFGLNGFLSTTQGAILFSALCATLVAVIAMLLQARTARKRATLDMLCKKEWDRDYIAAKEQFNKLKSESDLVKWAAKDAWNTEESNNIRNTLNDYEMIAIGIRRKILDEKIYKLWMKTMFVDDFHAAESYISEVRRITGKSVYFTNFEDLATQWGAKDGREGQRKNSFSLVSFFDFQTYSPDLRHLKLQ